MSILFIGNPYYMTPDSVKETIGYYTETYQSVIGRSPYERQSSMSNESRPTKHYSLRRRGANNAEPATSAFAVPFATPVKKKVLAEPEQRYCGNTWCKRKLDRIDHPDFCSECLYKACAKCGTPGVHIVTGKQIGRAHV